VIILTGQGDKAFCSVGDQRVRGDSGYKTDEHATGRFHVTDLHVQMRRTPTRQFIEAHDGTVTATSVPARRTVFTIRLPPAQVPD